MKHGQHTISYRSIDGSDNNLADAQANAAGTDFTRIGPANFADGIAAPTEGPNPRTISNVVVAGGDDVEGSGLSGMMYAWGQFIDHDLDKSNSDGINHIDVVVPAGDPDLPDGSIIPLTRAVIDPATGTDAAHPATAVNAITGWLDGSMVYGSDAATAASLRTADGHMRTSAGDNLPIVNGMFAAGDARAAENPSLTALQTLFVREHNYQVDRLQHEHPHWSGDQLYEQARAIVGAEIAHITYAEFLPHLLGAGTIAPYQGYDPTVDARITEEFAGAAFRFGHSIVSPETLKLDNYGALIGEEIELRDAFFEPPSVFAADTGADGILRHLASDESGKLDVHIVDDLRNFLSDPPAALDLAATNIARAHDLGLGSLNQTRVALGLTPYTDFDQITSDPQTATALAQVYGTVDTIDLWTGGLSENPVAGAMVGQTFQAIIALQFTALRDGDRFWFENQGFDRNTLDAIEHTTLADIIQRNTDTPYIQDDVFTFYDRRSGAQAGVEGEHPDAPQLVIGSTGHDTLIGGALGDILVAAKGHQVLTGLGGDDRFVFDARGIKATITDFQDGHDTIDLSGLGIHALREVHIEQHHGNAVVQAGGDRIEVVGITAHQLDKHDFVFA